MRRMLTFLAVIAALTLLVLPAGAAPPPTQRIAQLERQVAALKTRVAQLRNENADLRAWTNRSWRRELALRRYAARRGPCAVTQPNGSQPPAGNFAGENVHGNGALWASLPPANVVVEQAEPNGVLTTKYPWWRAVTGALGIQGRRLDGAAPPLSASIPDGYGPTGFQASSITFPTEGCWEVTGRVGGTALIFVTLVLRS